MKKLRTRNNVVDYIKHHCTNRSIQRSIESGKLEFLGGFRPIPPGTDPGWILRCHSPITKKHWNVAIIALGSSTNYKICVIPKIQWENWIGDESGLELYRGDDPNKYESFKREIRGIIYDKTCVHK